MSLRTSLILMVIFMVLGTFALFDPLRTQQKEEDAKDRESHVVWLKDARLDSIAVSGKNPSVKFECTMKNGCPFDGTGDWKLAQPVEDKADPGAVGTLASSMLNLTQNDKIDIEGTPDPKEFGLDEPQATVEMWIKGTSEPIVLKFGKASAVGPNVYLSSSKDPHKLFLVPNYMPGMVNKELFHWRNKRLFPSLEAPAITRLGWKSRKAEVRALRGKDEWRLDRPIPAAASKIMLEGLCSTVTYAAAKSIFLPSVSSPEAKKALGKPETEIDFATGGAGGEHKLALYPKAGPARGARELLAVADGMGPVYLVDAAAFDRFSKDLLEYRQRSVIDDETRAKIDEVRFSFPREKREIVLKANGHDWVFVSGANTAGNLSMPRINGFLDSLRDASFLKFLPVKGASPEAKAYLAQTPDLAIELKGGGTVLAQAQFLVFDRRMALSEMEGDLRVLGESFLKLLPVRLDDLDQAANQTVVVQPGGSADGHSH